MVPEGWSATTLKSLIEVRHGFAFKSEFFADSGSFVLMTPGSFYEEGGFRDQGAKTKYYSGPIPADYLLKKRDVLLAMTEQAAGLLGSAAYVPEDGVYLHNQRLGLIVVKDESRVCSDFLYWVYNSESVRKQVSEQASGTKVKHTSPERLVGVQVLLPPVGEQKKIAAILEAWDRAITTAEQLLANSQQQKKALMQLLLDGKQRLPDFFGDWEHLRAESIFSPVSFRNNAENEELLAVTQDQGVFPRSLLERRVVMPSGDTSGYKLVTPGNFVISLRSFQGGLEHSKYRGLVSPAYTVLTTKKKISSGFYRHYFKSYKFIGQLAVAVVGIRDGKQISYGDFSFLKLPYPPLAEQEKIASVLDTADREIETLQQQLAGLKQEKKALMQQLLTGKRRVKIDET